MNAKTHYLSGFAFHSKYNPEKPMDNAMIKTTSIKKIYEVDFWLFGIHWDT